MRVRERIYDGAGHGWTDVSAWYWDALRGYSPGPWWAVTIVEGAQRCANPTHGISVRHAARLPLTSSIHPSDFIL